MKGIKISRKRIRYLGYLLRGCFFFRYIVFFGVIEGLKFFVFWFEFFKYRFLGIVFWVGFL